VEQSTLSGSPPPDHDTFCRRHRQIALAATVIPDGLRVPSAE
jgi:hypothetical protein